MAAPNLERQLPWYIGLRLVVVTSMALPYAFSQLTAETAEMGGPVPPFYGRLFGITCLLTLVYVGMLRFLRGRPELQAYIQFTADLLLITSLVFQFGTSSPFSPFYLVIIIVASVLLGQRAAGLIATASFVLYALLQLGLATGWLASPSGPTELGLTLRLAYSLFVHLVGFYGVAYLTSLLTRRVQVAEIQLETQREAIADLQVAHRDIIESVPSGLVTTDLEGHVTTLNRAGQLILGLEEPELVGRHLCESGLFSRDRWSELSERSGREGRYRDEQRFDRDGARVDIGFSLSPLVDSDGRQRGYILIFQDLTRWRTLEEELRLKDRMAAVGELAAGLAHEIGNPLAAISGSVQLLSAASDRPAGDSKLLEILFKESQRLDRTIKGFLRFARPKDRATVRFDIVSLLAENVELLRNSRELSERHSIELLTGGDEVLLLGDPDQISQIFWNLARNAFKAMPNGGKLIIRGEVAAGSYTMSFEDEGRGMSESERARLFIPFQSSFATGTGIGLAIVYRIVQEHGGRIHVDSEPGRGTQVRVELPMPPGTSEGEVLR
jgi:two-component system, NtrC family, sensor histidine kinase PilS